MLYICCHLCRGDGLNIFRNASGLELEKIKKQKQK